MTTAQPHRTPPGWRGVPLDDLPWAVLIRVAVCRGVLCMLLALIAFAFIPRPFGFTGTTIVSGSMRPVIQPGDVTLVKSVDEYLVGQVILFPNPARPDQRLLHRIVEIREDGMLVTKGDANTMEDSTPVDPSTVIGVGRILIPLIGLPIFWAGKGSILLVIATVIMTSLLIRGALTIEFLPGTRKGDAGRTILEGAALLIIFAFAAVVIVLGGFRSSFAGFAVRSSSTASWAMKSVQPTTTCSIVQWTLNTWPGNAIVTFSVRNETNVAVDPSWTLTWTFRGDEQVLMAFIGTATQTGRSVTYVAPGYMNIPPQGVQPGNPPQFQMTSATNTFAPPVEFRLNGQPCDFLPQAYSSVVVPAPQASTSTLPSVVASTDPENIDPATTVPATNTSAATTTTTTTTTSDVVDSAG